CAPTGGDARTRLTGSKRATRTFRTYARLLLCDETPLAISVGHRAKTQPRITVRLLLECVGGVTPPKRRTRDPAGGSWDPAVRRPPPPMREEKRAGAPRFAGQLSVEGELGV